MQYEVFISFKNSAKNGKQTPDAAAARKVHAALKGRGISTFFSEESLAEKGSGHFGKAIEAALDSSRVLILVASCREHIESRWVEAEWDSFLQDVRSGNKEGELFILNCGDLKPTDLPLFLRRQQMFKEPDLDKMLSFISSAMVPQATLNDLIELTLHCHRPEKNEDKVYLMTVQQGASAATRNVVAHWGARSSKRLNSQVKAVNVSADDATKELEKALQEKLRGGYAPASHVNLLTSEAWSFLAASLSVADTPPRAKPAKASAGKKPAKAPATAVAKKGAEAPKVASKAPSAAKSSGRATEAVAAVPSKPSRGARIVDEPKSASPAKAAMTTATAKAVKPAAAKKPQPAKVSAGSVTPVPAPAPASLPTSKPKVKAAAVPKQDSSAKKAAAKPEGAVVPVPQPAKAGGTVCISGKLPSGSKKADYAQPLKTIGLELVDDVVKGLSYLVVADPGAVTSKAEKASKLGIPILSEEQLKTLIDKAGKPARRK
jgi:DnaK suppressor protein